MVRLNKAVLYNEEFVNAGIVDYGHLINSAGELLDYDKVIENLIFLLITLPLLNLLNYVQQYLLAGKTTKIITYLITMTIYLLFNRLLTILLHFLQNGFIFV